MLARLLETARSFLIMGTLAGCCGLAGCQWSGPSSTSAYRPWEARRSFVSWNLAANRSQKCPCRTQQGHSSNEHCSNDWGHSSILEGCAVVGDPNYADPPNCGGCNHFSHSPSEGDTAQSLPNTYASKECCVPANVRLAQLPKSDLKKLMGTCPAPSPASMQGDWLGVNRGMMLALTGNATFIKRFRMLNTMNCVRGVGTNIRVCQVPLEQLGQCGWQPKLDAQTGQPDMHGNFLIINRDPLELDYRQADNPFFEPTRFLVDELVQVEEGLLLGRANLQLFRWRIPVAYFALYKAD